MKFSFSGRLALAICCLAPDESAHGQVPTAEDALNAVKAFAELSREPMERWFVSGTHDETVAGSGKDKHSNVKVVSPCDGPYMKTWSVNVAVKPRRTTVSLANPKYSALLTHRDGGDWSLEKLHRSSSPEYRSTVNPQIVVISEFGGPPYSLLFDEICSGTLQEVRADGDVTLFSVTLGPAEKLETPRPEFSEVEVGVAAKAAGCDLRTLRYRTRAKIGELDLLASTQFEFVEYQDTVHGSLPGSIIRNYRQLDVKEPERVLLESKSVRTYDYSKMVAKIPTEECFLAYYGLPEPEDRESPTPSE
jgi:hypothetical protein